MGWLSDFFSNPIDTLGNTGQKIIDNPIPALTAAVTQNPAALLSYAAPTSSGQTTQGLLGAAGGALQNQSNIAGNISAATAAQFRPVGVTNTFGTSNFQYDPSGNLTGAGYTLNPQLQGAQNYLMGGIGQNLQDQARIQAMGRQYMATSPQEQAQQYMANQQALLAPSRETQSANFMNQLSNTGREGLKVAQGGNLGMANPEYQALANARALQDLQLASQAQQQGQNRYAFGQGLLSSSYDPYNAGLKASAATEQLGQNPYTLSTGLATSAANAGANAGKFMTSDPYSYNTTGSLLSSLGNASAGILGNMSGGSVGSFGSIIPNIGSWYDSSSQDF
jgi:hypothetical protein